MAEARRPPLRARLHWYDLSTAEFALLTAMCEHSSDGSYVSAALPRLAAYAKLSVKQVQRLMHGYEETRTGIHVPGLRDRGILSQVAAKARKPAIYRINEEAMQVDPRMRPYEGVQPLLPGMVESPKVIPSRAPVSDLLPGIAVTPHPVTVSSSTPSPCPCPPVTVSPYSKTQYPKSKDSTAVTREHAMLWAEKNSYAYRAFCRDLSEQVRSLEGSNADSRTIVLGAAARAGIPAHIALALEGLSS